MWQIGTPIAGYYHGPGGGGDRWGPLTPGMARKLVDGGFNLAWGCSVEDLDVAHAHGLRVDLIGLHTMDPTVLDDPAGRAKLDSVIDSVKDHPALYSYNVSDEPSAVRFPEFARLLDYFRECDPNHLAYINLFPTYASAETLGTAGNTAEAYREHLRQYMEIVKPDLISYDHYNLLTDTDNDEYFLNLTLIREAALDGGVPFVNVVQACSLGPSHRVPNGDEGRYLAYTTLAYGGMGISQFVYWTRVPDFAGGISEFADGAYNAERAEADAAAALTPLGEALRQILPEFVAIAEKLQPLASLGVYHLGRLPQGGVELPADASFTVNPPVAPEQAKGTLLGYFGSTADPTHVLVVNLDYAQKVTTTVVGPGAMEEFDAEGRGWHPASDGSRAKMTLMAGGGKLLRLQAGP